MKNKGKLSKRTLGLLAATLVLVLATGGMGARAALSIFSQDYNAEFEMDHLDVALIENGEVAGEKDPQDLEKGQLLYHGHKDDGLQDGRLEPGRVYKEEIGARNLSDTQEYVRMSIRAYWTYTDEKGNRVKDNELDPGLIELYYVDDAGKQSDYNDSAWKLNAAETTTERKVYYLTDVLEGKKDSALLFNKFRVSDDIIKNVTIETETIKEGDTTQTIYTYIYDYDGYRACIEADVQSIQTHNGADAVTSLWGVENVTAADGKITVN